MSTQKPPQTPVPAAPSQRVAPLPQPGRAPTSPPAQSAPGATGTAPEGTPGLRGKEARDAIAKAVARNARAARYRAHAPRPRTPGSQYQPGMARRPPPGNDAA